MRKHIQAHHGYGDVYMTDNMFLYMRLRPLVGRRVTLSWKDRGAHNAVYCKLMSVSFPSGNMVLDTSEEESAVPSWNTSLIDVGSMKVSRCRNLLIPFLYVDRIEMYTSAGTETMWRCVYAKQ